MKLTSKPVRGSGARIKTPAATTAPGFRNPNEQVVVRDTGASSAVRDRQSIYELRCEHCRHRYGCNGMDIKARLCPNCQGGVPGETLRESQQAALFT
jgi:hypothetical protein